MNAAWAYIKAKHYWPLVAAILAFAGVAVWCLRGSGGDDTSTVADCTAVLKEKAALAAKLSSTAKAYALLKIKSGKPRPSTQPGCPDCPPCPEIDLSFGATGGTGGEGGGVAVGAASATATARAGARHGNSLGIILGGGVTADAFGADVQGGDLKAGFRVNNLHAEYGWGRHDGRSLHRVGVSYELFTFGP